jgi:hypothetical protein
MKTHKLIRSQYFNALMDDIAGNRERWKNEFEEAKKILGESNPAFLSFIEEYIYYVKSAGAPYLFLLGFILGASIAEREEVTESGGREPAA